jgi:hypothetical protein
MDLAVARVAFVLGDRMRQRTARTVLVILCTAFVLVGQATAALASPGQVPTKLTVTLPAYPDTRFGAHDVPCGVNLRVEATVVDAADAPIAGLTLNWTFSDSVDYGFHTKKDRIRDASSVTDANGVAVTRLYLECIPFTRSISAQLAGTPGTTILISSALVAVIVGPDTSIAPELAPTAGSDSMHLVVALVAAMLGAALFLRRRTVGGDR